LPIHASSSSSTAPKASWISPRPNCPPQIRNQSPQKNPHRELKPQSPTHRPPWPRTKPTPSRLSPPTSHYPLPPTPRPSFHRSNPTSLTPGQFDELHLRAALAETFTSLGVEAEQAWRLAARVRALLAFRDESTQASDQFWDDPDISWLLCKSESNGITYINQQCFDELLWWLQLPNLLAAADPIDPATLQQREAHVATLTTAAKTAGYDLTKLRAALAPKPEPEEVEASIPEPQTI